jgi:hypothetical protein
MSRNGSGSVLGTVLAGLFLLAVAASPCDAKPCRQKCRVYTDRDGVPHFVLREYPRGCAPLVYRLGPFAESGQNWHCRPRPPAYKQQGVEDL